MRWAHNEPWPEVRDITRIPGSPGTFVSACISRLSMLSRRGRLYELPCVACEARDSDPIP